MEILTTDPLAQGLIAVIHKGDVEGLRKLFAEHPNISQARIVDTKGASRTLLHIATDWPGHFPNVAGIIAALVEGGADPNAPMIGGNAEETPLHWAASSNDVFALDALLDGGANIESPGAIFTNGTPMSDAVIFAQWNAARRLLERGAKTTITQAAALGLLDRVTACFEQDPHPVTDQITAALWHGCRGGQLQTVQYLVAQGPHLNWVGWDHMTPLDCAHKSGNQELIAWLLERGAMRAQEF